MLDEYDTWSQVSIGLLKVTYGQASSRQSNFKVAPAWLLVSSSYSSAAEFRTMITYRLMGNQANEDSEEAILPFRVHIATND